MKTLSKTLSTLVAGAAILGTATFAVVTTPNQNNPAFASYATPEAGNSFATASYKAPESDSRNSSLVTASYKAPESGNSLVTAAVDAGATGRTVGAAG